MKKFLLILLTGFLSLQTFSQTISWFERNSGTSKSLTSASDYGVTLLPAVWVCGDSGTVLRSIDNGVNWENVGINGIPNNLMLVHIYGVNRNIAFTAGNIDSNTYVYKTSNGGANWTQVFSQNNGFINAVWTYFVNLLAFMCGNPVGGRWSLWKSSDQGDSWDSTGLYVPQLGDETGWNNSMLFQADRIWFGTNSSRIYYSSNRGDNWYVQSILPELNSFAVWFNHNLTIGFTGGTSLLTTSNQGNNWTANTSLGSGNFGGIIGVLSTSLSYIWYVRSDNIIYGSTNNGASWFKNYTAPSGNYKHITYSREQGTFIGRMWGVRDNGGITLGMIPLPDGISIISELIPSEFKLSQNYPNPFNPTTNFEFQIAKQGFTALKIYDILGREVTSLVNEELKAGTYKAVWNAETYPSGIYFAVLTAGGMKFTRKIALIK